MPGYDGLMQQADLQQKTDDVNDQVRAFLSASTFHAAFEAAQPLLQTSKAAIAAKVPEFGQALARWTARANDATETDRLPVLALVWRLTSLSSMAAHRKELERQFSVAIDPIATPLTSLVDPKDRRAVAEALALAPPSGWLAEYAAVSIAADGDPKSEARDVLCAVLLRQTEDVGRSFALLAAAMRELSVQQVDAAAGRARRTAWILRSLRPRLYENEDAGADEEFGSHFAQFVNAGLGSSRTSDRAAITDGVREALMALSTTVRLHGLLLAAHAPTYSSLEGLKRRFGTTDWPEELRGPVHTLARQILEALMVLARQNIADSGLRRAYLLLLGDVVGGMKLRQAASSASDINPELAYWLEKGVPPETIENADAIGETAIAQVDADLARALREVTLLESGASSEDSLRRLRSSVREAARKRGLTLRGAPGDLVEFSPSEHETNGSVLGHRRVRLLTSIVEKVAGGRAPSVVLKADVAIAGGNDGED